MESILEYIEGQSAEDLTIAVLAYLLSNRDQKIFLRYLLLRLLSDIFNIDEPLADIEVTFQAQLDSLGIADLMIESDKHLIIIENKFYAHFSQGDQVKRYVEYLKTKKNDRKAVFVLLTPQDRGEYYWAHLQEQIEIKGLQGNNIFLKRPKLANEDKSIEIVWLAWEKLL